MARHKGSPKTRSAGRRSQRLLVKRSSRLANLDNLSSHRPTLKAQLTQNPHPNRNGRESHSISTAAIMKPEEQQLKSQLLKDGVEQQTLPTMSQEFGKSFCCLYLGNLFRGFSHLWA
jgi:hypothetical protein